ncbi:hypothetical protein KM917_06155 [Virgibacillus pantothenticus]|uniref:hypothetical protein n=1 Tax=Virgibacillus TaxID=84406 RepID=UPI00067C44F2|nr:MULTISPECIES: hypothetical protein [Virgibacillus]API93307.1 hypothetical protein BKP57_16690 [Virgibacillus sp. 6R]MBS7428644.1 hypothetical protein [Virgibacillus sp. 19R1-5]MBU8599586.1 hypothetical protein [Virgibacillus pantothenticus]MBU8634033.1 hypothetical protein [Virgibacillus pantothenticus]MBU8642073.1 hypothetical protein [Virgibacillus pantothenticus]
MKVHFIVRFLISCFSYVPVASSIVHDTFLALTKMDSRMLAHFRALANRIRVKRPPFRASSYPIELFSAYKIISSTGKNFILIAQFNF